MPAFSIPWQTTEPASRVGAPPQVSLNPGPAIAPTPGRGLNIPDPRRGPVGDQTQVRAEVQQAARTITPAEITARPDARPFRAGGPQEGVGRALATGARVVFPIAGAIAGGAFTAGGGTLPGSAVGALAGEFMGRLVEDTFGLEPTPLGESTLNVGLAALPFGRAARPALQAVTRAGGGKAAQRLVAGLATGAEGALVGGGQEVIRSAVRGEDLELGDVAGSAALGFGLGAAFGSRTVPSGRARERRRVTVGEVLTPVRQLEQLGGRLQALAAADPKALADFQTVFGEILGEGANPKNFRSILQAAVRDPQVANNPQFAQAIQELRKGVVAAIKVHRGNQPVVEKLVNGVLDDLGVGELMRQATPEQVARVPLFKELAELRKTIMVLPFATQARNTVSNLGKYGLEVMDRSLQHVIQGDPVGAVRTLYRGVAIPAQHIFNSQARRETEKLINMIPEIEDKLLQTAVFGEVKGTIQSKLGKRVAEAGQVFNLFLGKPAELAARRINFQFVLEDLLGRNGFDPRKVMASAKAFEEVPLDILHSAAEAGLANTFALEPARGIGKTVVNLFRVHPAMSLIQPFPRFMVNAMNHTLDFAPTGIFRLLGREASGQFRAADPQAAARVLSRAILGTTLLSAGLALRGSGVAGPRADEVIIPKEWTGSPHILRFNALAPLTSFMHFGEMMKQVAEHGSLERMSNEEILEAALALRRTGEAGQFFTDLAAGDLRINDIEGMRDTLHRAVDDVLASYLVPFRTIDDVVNFEGSTEIEDVRGVFLGQSIRQLPGPLQQALGFTGENALESRPNVLSGETRVSTSAPRLRALGVTINPTSDLELRFRDLGLEPHVFASRIEGVRPQARDVAAQVSRRADDIAASVHSSTAQRLFDNEQFQALDRDLQRRVATEYLNRVRSAATDAALAELARDDLDSLIFLETHTRAGGVKSELRRRVFEALESRRASGSGPTGGLGSR